MVDGVVLLGKDVAELPTCSSDAAQQVRPTGDCEEDGERDGAERGEAGAPHEI